MGGLPRPLWNEETRTLSSDVEGGHLQRDPGSSARGRLVHVPLDVRELGRFDLDRSRLGRADGLAVDPVDLHVDGRAERRKPIRWSRGGAPWSRRDRAV